MTTMAPNLDLLREYTKDQTNSINNLATSLLPDSDFPAWNELWRSVWGVQAGDLSDKKHIVVRSPHPDAIDDSSLLPHTVPPSCLVMPYPAETKQCWKFKCEKIFIRSVYNKAEEFALSCCDNKRIEAVIFSRQPGIGKSAFLFRILLHRLRFELPTALQIRSDLALLFYKDGVKKFSVLNYAEPYSLLEPKAASGRIWALVDANRDVQAPSLTFQGPAFFIIQASSPRPERYDWTKLMRCKVFYMEPWSFAEVLQVRSLIDPDMSESVLFNMHITFGASLRNLFVFSDGTNDYERLVDLEISKLHPAELTKQLQNPLGAQGNSHLLVTTTPSPSDRTISERKISSLLIFEKICKMVFNDRTDQIRTFYDTLRNDEQINSAAGMFFEARVHQVLREGGVINLFPIRCKNTTPTVNYVYSEYAEEATKRLVLPASPGEVVSKGQIEAPVAGIYYRPLEKNFPAFDSWLCLQPTPEDKPIHLRFQITLAQKHHVAMKGLEFMDVFVSDQAVEKYLVVVTEEGIHPTMSAPKDYLDRKLKKLKDGDPNTALPMYHLSLTRDQVFSSLPQD